MTVVHGTTLPMK